MKKISFIFTITFFTLMINSAFAAADVQKAYQTYLNKLRTCSPYTYNVDGDTTISSIVGWYNRRCVIRTYTYTKATECTLRNDELKAYLKTMPPAKVYAQYVGKPISELEPKTANRIRQFLETDKELFTRGTCVASGEESNDNQ